MAKVGSGDGKEMEVHLEKTPFSGGGSERDSQVVVMA